MGNLNGLANGLGAGNLGGDLFGDIFANNLGDLGTDRPLGPAIFLLRRAGVAFINHNCFAFIYNLGFDLVFHDFNFGTFLFGDGGTFFFGPGFGDIPEALFALRLAFRHNLDIGNQFGDLGTNILTFFLRHRDRNLTGFWDTEILSLMLVPKRNKIKVTRTAPSRNASLTLLTA